MAYVTIPKDLTKVKSKVLFGLTVNWSRSFNMSWTTMRLCTPDMTNTVLIWTRSSMTLMC